MTKLKPCPFCGGKAVLRKDDMYIRGESERCAWVYCSGCNARTNYFRREKLQELYAKKAREAWNLRGGRKWENMT